MLVGLALFVLVAALLSAWEADRREARLRAGVPAWIDLAYITGLADRRELARLPGVSVRGDGTLSFNPALRPLLPEHVTGAFVGHRHGHGLSVAIAVAASGAGFVLPAVPTAALVLLAVAAAYELVARLYQLAILAESCSIA